MRYLKKDMQFVHYRWLDEETADSLFAGEPSRRIFDPYNGNQVLFLINYFMAITGDSTLGEAREIENKIAYKLPLDSKSERSVLNWLSKDGAFG